MPRGLSTSDAPPKSCCMRKLINRKDSNHKEIVKKFKDLDWFVTDVSDTPKICDIRIDKLIEGKHVSVVIEIKDGEKPPSSRKITKDEFEYLSNFPGNLAIIEDTYDCEWVHHELSRFPDKVYKYKLDVVLERGIKKC